MAVNKTTNAQNISLVRNGGRPPILCRPFIEFIYDPSADPPVVSNTFKTSGMADPDGIIWYLCSFGYYYRSDHRGPGLPLTPLVGGTGGPAPMIVSPGLEEVTITFVGPASFGSSILILKYDRAIASTVWQPYNAPGVGRQG